MTEHKSSGPILSSCQHQLPLTIHTRCWRCCCWLLLFLFPREHSQSFYRSYSTLATLFNGILPCCKYIWCVFGTIYYSCETDFSLHKVKKVVHEDCRGARKMLHELNVNMFLNPSIHLTFYVLLYLQFYYLRRYKIKCYI